MNFWIEHIPLKEKSFSGSENCSFLFQQDNIFIMDNHRLALWCWQYYLKSINSSSQFNFFHLDAHEDAKVDLSAEDWNEVYGMSLEAYMHKKSASGSYLKYRWDNYLPVLIHENQAMLRKSVFATHDVGLAGYAHKRIKPYNLLQDFPKLFVDELQWIINIDLDYFYPREFKNNLLFDPGWIEDFFYQLKKQYDAGDVLLMSIALSPECCGSWSNAEKVLRLFDEVFNLGLMSNTALK